MLIFDNSDYQVHALALGPLRTNCFIVENSTYSFLIDPVGEGDLISSYLADNNISIDFCMATHGHFDHVGAAAHLIEQGFCQKLYIHEDDAVELRRCNTYSLLLDKKPIKLPSEDQITWFDADFSTHLKTVGFKIEHLASHTAGSTIFYTQDRQLLFSGDILLRQPKARNNRCKIGESKVKIEQALLHISETFHPETIVFPGHGKMMRLDSEHAMQDEIQDS
ncbi:MAG: MBL fold metallo-hydrolase [Magnetovibrio sp.]|nr:MBL fold metallo-hydrolase [Magnetovibrio sp.]